MQHSTRQHVVRQIQVKNVNAGIKHRYDDIIADDVVP